MRPSEAIVTAVAELTQQSPLEIDLLNETIDPDAVDRVLDSRTRPDSSVTVSFEYCNLPITVTSTAVHIEQQE